MTTSPKQPAPCDMRNLGYTKEHIEVLLAARPDPNVTIAGFATTLKSPVLAKLVRQMNEAAK